MITRSCSKCDSTIFIAQINGISSAFEDPMLSILHRCHEVKTPSSITERVSLLEKIARKQDNKIYLLQEKIDELSKGRI